ncbi:DUF1293 family protein [Vibrio rotiferianus]|jgi:hypothetical protein|uniref:DUF1293 family protein n=1 Tax=Vibrio rotiferianus TaxID=190895 RepID=UPI0011105EBC|nr:DUF1293 family protein [Vibrio rotiferianus]NOH69434.1 DUF1293 domain-containing protein [Vibrio rotiferianus]TMX55903.1 hypothetical protein DA097_24370 [Vibrio rotiferianus]TMX62384.1 hypothetical protein DA097_15575 [Vibrio rotiferianus]TMX73236.1 hypothetical protein DA097_01615 [Vibrio rotiferianus]CAH1536334.1 conserved hypothetical protein [Vibrio rotiferianus]
MAKSVFVLGMDITWNSARGDSAQLNISRPLREINSEKFKRRTIGESGDVNPQWDQPLMMDHEYALLLERTGALVPRREYELRLEINPEDPLAGAIVTQLIPVDAEIKKHFEASLGKQS